MWVVWIEIDGRGQVQSWKRYLNSNIESRTLWVRLLIEYSRFHSNSCFEENWFRLFIGCFSTCCFFTLLRVTCVSGWIWIDLDVATLAVGLAIYNLSLGHQILEHGQIYLSLPNLLVYYCICENRRNTNCGNIISGRFTDLVRNQVHINESTSIKTFTAIPEQSINRT